MVWVRPWMLPANMMVAPNSPSARAHARAAPAINAGAVLNNFNSPDSAWPYLGSAPDIGAFETATGAVPSAPLNLRIIR